MRFALALVLSVSLTSFAAAQEREQKFPSVTVSAEAIVMVEPDQAEIDVGVVTEAKTAAQAAKDNAAKAAAVIAEVKKLLKAGDQTKTVGYSVSPVYRNPSPREGGKPEIAGYSATNVVQVRTAAISDVGRLVDTATQAGANRIQRLVFTLKDEEAPQREALKAATVKAKAKAEEMARALGVKIARVLSVVENERSFRPFMRESVQMLARAAPEPTPIESGSVQVRSAVTLTAEISGQ